jgi:beta-N-acetylhexosaminidase
MTSWALYPALDRSRPSGLSSAIIQGQLRNRLGFRGVTITDAIEAGAIGRFGGIGRRAVLAARAGQDLLLFSNKTVGEGDQGLSALASALRRGQLSLAGFRAAAARVLALRQAVSAHRPLPPP